MLFTFTVVFSAPALTKKELIPKSCNKIIETRNNYCGGKVDLNSMSNCVKRYVSSEDGKESLLDCQNYFKYLMGTFKSRFFFNLNDIGPSLIDSKEVLDMVLEDSPLPTIDAIEDSFFAIKENELSFKDTELLKSVAAITVTIASTVGYIIQNDSSFNTKLENVIQMSFYAFTSGDSSFTSIANELQSESDNSRV